jgi:hypothetical protein
LASASVVPDPSPSRPLRGVRWYVCALLFFVTAINYVDRVSLGPATAALGVAGPALVALLGLALAYASRTQRPVVAS